MDWHDSKRPDLEKTFHRFIFQIMIKKVKIEKKSESGEREW
jgi:hypothetical protein